MKTEHININQVGEITDFLQDFAQKLSHDLAEQAEEDMIKAHKNIVKDFYDSYSPTSYKRREVLYDTLINHKFYSRVKYNYFAKIEIGSSNMLDHYRTDPENVFDLFWNHGVRGLPPQGNNLLNHTYWWKTSIGYIRFMKGTKWRNYDWDLEKHKNIFQTDINKEIDEKHKPHFAMREFINQWGKKHGQKLCEQIVNRIVK